MARVTPPIIGQKGQPAFQQQQSIATAINGGIEFNSPTSVDTNGWANTFEQANTNSATIRINPTGGSAPAWTAANTKIAHNLGKVPTGWHVIYMDKVVTVIAGTSKPDVQFIYLTISDDTATTTLMIF
jgi:hypothetical protein